MHAITLAVVAALLGSLDQYFESDGWCEADTYSKFGEKATDKNPRPISPNDRQQCKSCKNPCNVHCDQDIYEDEAKDPETAAASSEQLISPEQQKTTAASNVDHIFAAYVSNKGFFVPCTYTPTIPMRTRMSLSKVLRNSMINEIKVNLVHLGFELDL